MPQYSCAQENPVFECDSQNEQNHRLNYDPHSAIQEGGYLPTKEHMIGYKTKDSVLSAPVPLDEDLVDRGGAPPTPPPPPRKSPVLRSPNPTTATEGAHPPPAPSSYASASASSDEAAIARGVRGWGEVTPGSPAGRKTYGGASSDVSSSSVPPPSESSPNHFQGKGFASRSISRQAATSTAVQLGTTSDQPHPGNASRSATPLKDKARELYSKGVANLMAGHEGRFSSRQRQRTTAAETSTETPTDASTESAAVVLDAAEVAAAADAALEAKVSTLNERKKTDTLVRRSTDLEASSLGGAGNGIEESQAWDTPIPSAQDEGSGGGAGGGASRSSTPLRDMFNKGMANLKMGHN